MGRIFRNNGLSIVLAGLFLIVLLGQALAGQRDHNNDRKHHAEPPIGFVAYLGSGHFLEAVFENWESEFLQMGCYVLLTVFLRQKGSAESKKLDELEEVDRDPRERAMDPAAPAAVRRGGWILKVYEHSLSLAFLGLFAVSFVLHGICGLEEHNSDLREHGESEVSLGAYMSSSRFWFESFQNWQSEFLAVGAIVVLSIFLRKRGSPESKPVAAPHSATSTA
jgi:hypothetical protein